MTTAKPRIAHLATLMCAVVLSGCAVTKKLEPSEPPLAAGLATEKASDHFTVSGRFAAKRGEAQGNGQFRYEQRGVVRVLDLFSPTATQLACIEADGLGARAALSDGTYRQAKTLSELLRQFVDIPINDAEFSSWLQGVPRAATPTRDSAGKIESFRESGWTVVVSSRFEGDAKFVRRMRWTFDAGGDPAQDAQVTWVFDDFSTQ
jgi:outer membrane biogenesis lipoprotein LolB